MLSSLLAVSKAEPAATIGSIQIVNPWARVADKGSNSAAFMVIKNTGNQTNKLTKADYTMTQMTTLMETNAIFSHVCC